jgi:hypothetical protein
MAKQPDPAPLLTALAAALTGCEQAGLKPKLRHGGVIETKGGFVMRSDAGWVPRTRAYTEFAEQEGDDDD